MVEFPLREVQAEVSGDGTSHHGMEVYESIKFGML